MYLPFSLRTLWGCLPPTLSSYRSTGSQGMDSFINEFIETARNFCLPASQVRPRVPRSRAPRSCAPRRVCPSLLGPPTPRGAAADRDRARQPVVLQPRLPPRARKTHHVLLMRPPKHHAHPGLTPGSAPHARH